MNRSCLAFAFVLALVWGFGCSSPQAAAPATPVAPVKGTATMDGKPLPTGEVHFSLAGASPQVLEIKDGAFSGEAPVGKNQVEIYIYVEGPASAKYGGTKSKTNTAPQKYWGPNTALSAEIAAGKTNEFKFEMTSK